jgi:hypothetical protein
MRDVGFPCILWPRRSCDEAQALCRRTDYFDPEGARGGRLGSRVIATPRGSGEHDLPLEIEVWWYEVSEAKRLRELEQENARLKKLLAEAELDKAALKEFVRG